LNLPTERATSATWHLFDGLVVPLATALDEGKRFLDDRPASIARQAVQQLDLRETVEALQELGWGKTFFRNVTADDLRNAATDRLVANLTNHVQRMMLRWERKGLISNPPPTAA
ncbi:MAG: hypothetical protein LC749_11260, partial [Actinobacteria bacterium]|nr:hypothetical protein [Actinomycetota bacterium]